MATAKQVREFVGNTKSRGRLTFGEIATWNEANPSDPYDAISASATYHYQTSARKTSVHTFKTGTNKNGKAYKVPVSKTVKLSDVRAWAADNGKTVGKRGRVSAELLAEFAAR